MIDERIFKRRISRRDFCKLCFWTGLGIGSSFLAGDLLEVFAQKPKRKGGLGFLIPHQARYYQKLDEETIQCNLCPRRCQLKNWMRGFCRAREHRNGKHYTLVYGNPTAVHIDPIEKKPLFHFLPSTMVFSIATAGCNFRCKYCQNWQISQFRPEETVNLWLPPEEVVARTLKYKCPTIAYTYTEPSIFFEYMIDTAKLAQRKGIKNVYHSNGSLNPEPVEELSSYLEGANIDLKGFAQEFYSKVCEGFLETVKNTIKILKKRGVHVELTNLIVPTLNDDMEMIKEMCRWIRDEVSKDTPLHFSRFFPTFKLKNLPPTPVPTLEKAREVALSEGLEYVYIGNVPGHEGENTYCPQDGKILIRRVGYKILENNLVNGKCKFCGRSIPGVWE